MTLLMKGAHSADFAADVCFVDYTVSCDADNHILTFMLTVTAAGAVPLGVVTPAASHADGFSLLKSTLPERCFGRHDCPLFSSQMTVILNGQLCRHAGSIPLEDRKFRKQPHWYSRMCN